MAKGKVMDTKKFKSIALPIEAYEIAKELAEKNERSIARQISFLLREATQSSPPSKRLQQLTPGHSEHVTGSQSDCAFWLRGGKYSQTFDQGECGLTFFCVLLLHQSSPLEATKAGAR